MLFGATHFGFLLRAELQIVQLRPVIISSVCSVNLLSIGMIHDLLAHLRPHRLILDGLVLRCRGSALSAATESDMRPNSAVNAESV